MSNEQKKDGVAKVNPLKKLEQQLAAATNVKDMLKIDVISQRYIANYEAGTGRTDGKETFEREAFAFMEIANADPEIMKCDRMSIFAGFIKSGFTGLPFSSGKLSIYPRGGKLVVEPDAHGKKEMMQRMKEIKKIDEAVVVFADDIFVIDAIKKLVVKHEQSFPVPEAKKETVKAAYCCIHFTDGHREDVIMSIHEIEKARLRSRQPNGIMWKDHYGEACKKTTYNRGYKVHYKRPETSLLYKQFEGDDEQTVETTYEEETKSTEPEAQEVEVVHEVVKQEVEKKEPVKQTRKIVKEEDDFT